jgi:hypothetical protein
MGYSECGMGNDVERSWEGERQKAENGNKVPGFRCQETEFRRQKYLNGECGNRKPSKPSKRTRFGENKCLR